MSNTPKTIFLSLCRGFLVKNILRSGVLDALKQNGFRVVVFFDNDGMKIPESLRKEFESDTVILENAPHNTIRKRGHHLFAKLSLFLLSSDSTWVYSHIGHSNKNMLRGPYWRYLEYFCARLLCRFSFLKTTARFIEENIFITNAYAAYFKKYQPVLVFSTSMTSTGIDIPLMKEARRYGVKTVSMPKGWDDTTKIFYRFIPDILLVQNGKMKEAVVRFQNIPAEKVLVTGFPQFDWYKKQDILQSREEYCVSLGLDPQRKLILFGSEGRWAPHGDTIVSLLTKWVSGGELKRPSSLFIRPHFSEAKENPFARFKSISDHVVVDDSFTLSDFFKDGWNPGIEEIKKFVNLLYHSDVVITIASTLTLDAACFDKPNINVNFKVLYDPGTGKDVSHILYAQDHFGWVFETNGVDVAISEEELKAQINHYLIDPSYKREGRKMLRDEVCYKVDGRSSERIAQVISDFASNSHTHGVSNCL